MAKIISVAKFSVAEEVGIKCGDELIAFDGSPVEDILDYYYFQAQENLVMTILQDGELTEFEIEKDEDEDIGLEFDESFEIKPVHCKNKCKFCFVDQLPKGMRETLYVKDDDYRYSFVMGSYITLTNLGEKELERIVKLKLSPLYISVHASDDAIRKDLVTNPESLKTMQKIKFLAENNIYMHTQIVLCKGLNDRDVLTKTMKDLYNYYPQIKSLAVVPVGLTKHRENLAELDAVDKLTAIDTITRINNFNKKLEENWVFGSDELYLKALIKLPDFDYYGDFEQIENGVGLIRTFENNLYDSIEKVKINREAENFTFITGVSFAPFLKKFVNALPVKFPFIKTNVIGVINQFFGESVTVAGLITGRDIIKQCQGKVFKNIVIPSTMLKEFTDMFLDGVTVSELGKQLNANILICRDGGDLVEMIENVLIKKHRK